MTVSKSWKIVGYLAVAALLLIVVYQPWTYNLYGFSEARIAIAGGEMRFDLLDQARSKNRNSYCLFSSFTTYDKPGEQVSITIDKVGTKSVPELKVHVAHSGTTAAVDDSGKFPSYFSPPGLSRLVFPTDEPVDVIGSIRYKGVSHPFRISLKLKHWQKSRAVTQFCA